MKKAAVADATLRMCDNSACTLGFKEKIEIVKQLEKLCVDVIETAPLLNGKSDVLFLHTIAPLAKKCTISCAVPLDEKLAEISCQAISKAANPRLNVIAPVSTVQMEYHCHCKPAAVLEKISAITGMIKNAGIETEVSFADATRAEHDFLVSAIRSAISAGAQIITLCDSAGEMLPAEITAFISNLQKEIPELDGVTLSIECSDELHIGLACAIISIRAGIRQIKTATGVPGMLDTESLADILNAKGAALGIESNLNRTACSSIISSIRNIMAGKPAAAASRKISQVSEGSWKVGKNDDMAAVAKAVKALGYELSADDLANVYEEVQRLALKKDLGPQDLDAVVATAAMQVPPTYTLKSFVINSGNIITSMAHIVLLKNGEEVQGFSMGDGPIDAAFLSIENIVGRHFELDDFQITAVTEGREAVGSGIVRLRSNGKLYSGKGISTDVIGAGIRAYVDALNKICYEENN